MSHAMMVDEVRAVRTEKSKFYQTVAFMGCTAIVVCSVIIVYFNRLLSTDAISDFLSRSELAAVTLIPYLISAVIAALTAVAIMSIAPVTRFAGPSVHLVASLREIAEGDLTTRLKLKTEDPLRDVANELNIAVDNLSHQLSQWKVLNRVQWGTLCRIRMSAEHGDLEDTLHFVGEMEKNWDKIAEIERSLIT